MDRSFGGAVVYEADGTTENIDFDGSENTFFLDVSSEFDFFGYSYDPAFTDDSEVVVLEGSVGSGIRSIEFGESTSDVEDWDVVSFDGLDSGVSIDLSQVDSNYDVTATVPGTGVEGVEGTESTPDSLPDGISVSDGIKTLGSNGHYYEVVTTAMTWSDAKAYAESLPTMVSKVTW